MIATALFLALAVGGQGQTLVYTPAMVKVLVVPTINASGDKYKAMKIRQDEESDNTLHRLFASRGFGVLPIEKCSQEVAESNANATPSDSQEDHLYKLGTEAGAQLVVFTEITKTWQHEVHVLVVPTVAGYTTFKTWLLDVPNHRAILSGTSLECRSTAIAESGSERQTRAIRLGLEAQLKPFLEPYSRVAQ